MPIGFPNVAFPTRTINSYGQDQNCYYVTIAALLGKTVEDLTGETELMQNITGTDADIKEVFRAAGVNVQSKEFTNGTDLYNVLMTLPPGSSVGMAYKQHGRDVGHMLVVQRDPGSYPLHAAPGIRCLDYQKVPIVESPFPPAPHIERAWIYFQA
ncbi:MAG: hypothetical protein VX699_04685 [Myxococcota bacterium]|nr:hypothetical protein [Myxococcota bacterium]